MSALSINKLTTVDELIKWKVTLDGYIASILFFQSQLSSAMAMDYSNSITPAEVQFRFDSKLNELTGKAVGP